MSAHISSPLNRSDDAPTLTVSVIICAYTEDRWDLLGRAVDSVLAQSVPPVEVFLCIDHNDALFERASRFWADSAVARGPQPLRRPPRLGSHHRCGAGSR